MNSDVEISKVNFMLKPDWIIQEPIDFEHKKYVLLSYLKRCEEKFNNGEVYPYFIELSLHFANAQIFEKENKLLYTDKIFKSPDDELLIQELKSLELPVFTAEENEELKKINKYFTVKIYEYFSVAKSLWSLTFESTTVTLKKKNNPDHGKGFMFYNDTFNNKSYIWEYISESKDKSNTYSLNLIYINEKPIKYPLRIINKYTTWVNEPYREYPILKALSTQNLPLNHTLLPIFKRKLFLLINTLK
jgi:hypothetical protein